MVNKISRFSSLKWKLFCSGIIRKHWDSPEATIFNTHIISAFIVYVLVVNVSIVCCDGFDVGGLKDCFNEVILEVNRFSKKVVTFFNSINADSPIVEFDIFVAYLAPSTGIVIFHAMQSLCKSGIWKQSFWKYLCGFSLIFYFSTLKKRLKINNLLHLLLCLHVLHPCPKYVISSIEIILNITSTLDITYLGRNKIYYYVKQYPRC